MHNNVCTLPVNLGVTYCSSIVRVKSEYLALEVRCCTVKVT